ncbi:MAG: thermosome subunit alpha [Candidatus Thermoplasmatota archaeon]|nr:thermosome subunit alpha [Candidatus Thermoplasmatota archaeon]
MSGGDEAQLLNDTSRIKGKEALFRNIEAADALSGAIRSTLGPKGLDKMLVSDNGTVKITNDGVNVLKNAKIEHPIAKMLIDIAINQENTVRDGTTTSVLLASELLQNAWELYVKGIHPSIIANGYSLAYDKCNELIEEFAIKINNDKLLESATKTSLSGVGGLKLQETLTGLTCKAAKGISIHLKNEITANPNNVKIISQKGGVATDSYLVEGLVLAKQACSPDMKRNHEEGTILIIDGGIEKRKTTIQSKINFTDPSMISAFRDKELELISKQIENIIQLKPTIVVCRDGIDDAAIRLLEKNDITAYRRVERNDFELLSRACSASIVASPMSAKKSDLGFFKGSYEENWSGVVHWILKGTKQNGVTLVIRGSSDQLIQEIEISFLDALSVACQIIENGKVLSGGGATQMALSRTLKEWSQGFEGRESLAILAYADALEIIPRTLAINAGLDPIDQILALNAAQASAKSNISNKLGIDIHNSTISNMYDLGVIETIQNHQQCLAGSTSAAISILRIDDVLWAKNDPTIPEGIGEEEGLE